MLSDTLFILWNDLRVGLRQKETLLWTFLMPLVFFYFIGTVTRGLGTGPSHRPDALALMVPADAGFLADELERQLGRQNYAVQRYAWEPPTQAPAVAAVLPPDSVATDAAPAGSVAAHAAAAEQALEIAVPQEASSTSPASPSPSGLRAATGTNASPGTLRLEVPPGFTDLIRAGHRVSLVLRQGQSGLSAEYDQFRVRRAAYTLLADVLAAGTDASADAAGGSGRVSLADLRSEHFTALHETPRTLTLEVTRAGHARRIPTGFDQAVPGTMVMFTMLIILTAGITSLLIERKSGVLRRLASSPIHRGAIVAGKWGSKLVLGLMQIAFAMIVGSLLFGVDWGPELPALLAVLVAYAGFLAALAILIGNFARSEAQAVGLSVLAANVFGALGGCWWPIEVTPAYMQKLALLLPTGWTMDALHKLVYFGAGFSSVRVHIFGMLLGTIILGAISARVFRFEVR